VQPTAPDGRGQGLAVLAVLAVEVAVLAVEADVLAAVAAWAGTAPTPSTVVPSMVVLSSVAAVTGTRIRLRKSGT
jgi:hypothetical protein